jgi:two-component system sensor kinase FixL
VRKDGTDIEVNVLNTITHDVSGHLDIVIGQIEDLTPQIQAQVESREQREQLAHADRLNTLGEMATGLAHEINQPLTAISLFAQAGKRLYEAGSNDRLPEIFGKLSQHAQRAGAIIERMQTMSRQQESQKEIADCNALVLDIAKLAEAEAGIRDITIEVEVDEKLLLVVVDTVQIQQVALNLLRNGMQAMRSVNCRSGNTITLRTRLNNDGDIEVAVSDSGGGVSKRVAKNMFKSFSTTKESGMGLGLSITRAIVVAHGGQLGYHNNETGGATFSFTLPAATQGDQNG